MDHKNKDIAEYVKKHLENMKQVRAKGESLRWEACSYLAHRIPAYTNGDSAISDVPLFFSNHIYDVGTTCRGIAAYMVSPSVRWFRFRTMGPDFQESDDIYGANDWLEFTASLIQNEFSNSRFYATTLLAIMDCFISGTSFEMISDNVEDRSITYDCYDPIECYITDNANRNVNRFFREYEITADQAYEKWGNVLPHEVVKLVNEGAGHNMCTFVHAIFPKAIALNKNGTKLIKGGKRFASVHYSKTGDQVFSIGGYDSFPLAVQRWALKGTSPYGVSPVMEFLPAIKDLNELSKQFAVAVQMQNSPPLLVPEALKGRMNFRPGAINYGSVQTGQITPIQTQLNIQYVDAAISRKLDMLNQMLFANLFNVLMRQDRQRTAYEVQELKGEGLVLLSSIIGNMQVEKLNPIVMRTFEIMAKANRLPPPPPELVKISKQGQVKVELDGPLAQNMKAYHQTTGLMQGLQAVVSTMQAFPDSLANIDGDKFLREFATAMGMPQSVIREKADVNKIKREQALQAQAQAKQQQAVADSQVLKNLQGVPGSAAQQMAQGLIGGMA
jgi:hypothetical protein